MRFSLSFQNNPYLIIKDWIILLIKSRGIHFIKEEFNKIKKVNII